MIRSVTILFSGIFLRLFVLLKISNAKQHFFLHFFSYFVFNQINSKPRLGKTLKNHGDHKATNATKCDKIANGVSQNILTELSPKIPNKHPCCFSMIYLRNNIKIIYIAMETIINMTYTRLTTKANAFIVTLLVCFNSKNTTA